MKKILFFPLLLTLIFVSACQQDDVKPKLPFGETIGKQLKNPIFLNQEDLKDRSANNCYWTEVPAGSEDALQTAIDNTCEHGVVYLKSGSHTELSTVSINKSIKIIGEDGATLSLNSGTIQFPEDPVNYALTMDPGIYIKDAPSTLIQNVTIIPSNGNENGNGSTAILINNSPHSAVMQSQITDFQFGVVIVNSDQITAMFNTIETAKEEWYNELILDAYGIMVVSGKSIYISQNDFSDAVMGVWASDQWGTISNNAFHDSFIGMLLCLVPPYVIMPDGAVEGAPTPAEGWKVRNNDASDNLTVGYLVIDGAIKNTLTNNTASNNGTYDIELAGDSYRFGYLTPRSIKNSVVVGSANGIIIKDCGEGNEVSGNATMVDTSVDACD